MGASNARAMKNRDFRLISRFISKNLQFMHKLTANYTSKTTKITKCAAAHWHLGDVLMDNHLFVIFCSFRCVICSLFTGIYRSLLECRCFRWLWSLASCSWLCSLRLQASWVKTTSASLISDEIGVQLKLCATNKHPRPIVKGNNSVASRLYLACCRLCSTKLRTLSGVVLTAQDTRAYYSPTRAHVEYRWAESALTRGPRPMTTRPDTRRLAYTLSVRPCRDVTASRLWLAHSFIHLLL